jgi:hypothetical protein
VSIYRVRTEWTGLAGTPWLSTHYFDAAGGTPLQAVTAERAFWLALVPQITNQVTAQVQGVVDTLGLSGTLEASDSVTPPSVVTGTGTGDCLPVASQGCIKWQTGAIIGGRRLVGKTFIPGMIAGTQTHQGNVQPATITAVGTACAALISDANSQLVVWSRASSGSATAVSGALLSRFSVLRTRRD